MSDLSVVWGRGISRMTYRPPRIQSRISGRAVRLQAAFYGNTAADPKDLVPRKKTGKQAESKVGEANRQWARLNGGLLRRNRRGMAALPGGGKMPLGLSEPLIQDEVGYLLVKITPAMVNHTLPVLFVVEDKTDTGVVEPHQQACIDELVAVNAIAGVSRSVTDTEALVRRWLSQWENGGSGE